MLIGKLPLAKYVINSSISVMIFSLLIVQAGYGTDRRDEEIAESKNFKVARYQKDAEQGDAEAQYQLGRCYYIGKKDFPKDYDKAVVLYQKAANQEHAAAQCHLGLCYYYGEGIPQDYDKAIYLIRKAKDKGCHEARSHLNSELKEAIGYEKYTPPNSGGDWGYDGDDCYGGW